MAQFEKGAKTHVYYYNHDTYVAHILILTDVNDKEHLYKT